MAYSFPDGSRIFIGTALGSVVPITDATNASPAVLMAENDFVDGDEILVSSGWNEITDSVFLPSEFTEDSITLGGDIPIDTTETAFFPPGSGSGSARKVEKWLEIEQALNIASNGGDPKYASVDPLAQRNGLQIPVGFNPQNLVIDIGYDPSLRSYQALVAAGRVMKKLPIKITLVGGQKCYCYGYVSVPEAPKLQKGQANQVSATISLLGKFIGYQ